MAETAVQFEDVHVVFTRRFAPPVWALRGFNLTVPRGAVLGLLGPNGAGKTTCISCLLSLIEPQVGSVYLWGKPVRQVRPEPGASWGVVLEDTRLPPFMSVLDALKVVCALRGVHAPATEIDRVVALTSVADLTRRTVATLSKGQARRVGLTAALIGDPRLLVLDEPAAGLDPEARIEFDELVRALRDGERTMLIASHLLGDLEATCSHVAIVRDGRVALSGRADDLLSEARAGHASDVHVDGSASRVLESLGIAHEPSRYPGLVRLRSDLADEEIFAILGKAEIVPRRVEPRVNILSMYLDATGKERAP